MSDNKQKNILGFNSTPDPSIFLATRNKEQLITNTKRFIEKSRGILYKSSIGILKTGIKNATEKGDYSDLEEFLPIMKRKYERMKSQLEEKNKQDKKHRDFRINQYINYYTKEQLEKRLEKLEMESEKIYKWWTTQRRPDEKTMRKSNYFNKAEGIAKEMMLIKDALQKIIEEGDKKNDD